MTTKAPSIISLGAGTQSTAMVVLAAQGRLGIDIDAAVFAKVGDDSERPHTMHYLREVLTPWAAERGLPVHEVYRTDQHGKRWTSLLDHSTSDDNKSISIPARMPEGMPGKRSCTADWKIGVVSKWLKQHGATKANPATVCIGISTDEAERAGPRHKIPTEVVEYPLIDLRLNRNDCTRIIREAGLPDPGKSACFYCPFQSPRSWAEMRRDDPAMFDAGQDIEDALNRKRQRLGHNPVYLTRYGKRLSDAIHTAEPTLFPSTGEDTEGCDTGGCFT